MKNYIGIDISKATLDVYDGNKSYKFENTTQGFKKIVALCKNISETVFIFEPTGIYSYALTSFCSENHIGVVMVGPKESRDLTRYHVARGNAYYNLNIQSVCHNIQNSPMCSHAKQGNKIELLHHIRYNS